MSSFDADVPIALKWGKIVYTREISVQPGARATDLKRDVQTLTNVPTTRQKLLCPKFWKGALKDADNLPENFSIPKGHDALLVTLIGSAEVMVEKSQDERPRFVEDMTPEELKAAQRMLAREETDVNDDPPEGDIVALQLVPEDRNDGKMEAYQYNRLVNGLPQRKIEDRLRVRRESSDPGAVLGEVAMTLGLELRRAYVNSLAVLYDGTLVCALDDGHVEMWRRGELVKDVVHEGGKGGVDEVVAFPSSSVDSPAFATGGRGIVRIWNYEGDCIAGFPSAPGTTPTSLATGSISDNSDNGNFVYLASCVRVTHRSNPHQFRLVPQDEDGRRRRAAAEELEITIQENLAKTSRCVEFWIHSGAFEGSSALQLGSGIIQPDHDEHAAPVTDLVVVNDNLICGDEWGGIQIFKWYAENIRSNNMAYRKSAFLQFRCSGSGCRIACMEPVQDNLLAVSTDTLQRSVEEGSRLLSSAKPLQVTNPRAVFIVDLDRALIRAVLDAHSDVVQCMCSLPTGGLLSGGGKMDATVRVWEASVISPAFLLQGEKEGGRVEEEGPVLTDARKLEEPGYVFDLKVLPDSEPGSKIYAVAGARYNVVKIVI